MNTKLFFVRVQQAQANYRPTRCSIGPSELEELILIVSQSSRFPMFPQSHFNKALNTLSVFILFYFFYLYMFCNVYFFLLRGESSSKHPIHLLLLQLRRLLCPIVKPTERFTSKTMTLSNQIQPCISKEEEREASVDLDVL